MSLFIVPDEEYKNHAQNLHEQDGNTHVLFAQQPYNNEMDANQKINGLIDGMRKHNYQIIRVHVQADLHSHLFTTIIYK